MKRKITTSCFAFMTALVALLAFSCSNMNGSSGDSENSIDNKAYISLSVKNEVVRTALPSYELSEFNKFELFGKFGTGAESSIKSWESDATANKTAYDLMKDAKIQIEVGEWTFRLKATEASGTAYEGFVTKTLSLGANDIEFKIDLITIPESGKGNLSVGISVTPPGELSVVKAALYKNDETGTLVQNESPITGGSASFENLDAGSYKVVFNFYDENGLLLGTCPEYAIVVPGKTSSSSVELKSLDSTYTITYHYGETSTTEKYTRHTKVVLPNIESPAVSKEGYEFCGWFATNADAQGYTATAITEIPENTVGAQKFYAKYMSLADVTPIKSVKIEGDVKVGKKVKAVPYTKEGETTENDKFTGEVASYKWYRGKDSDDDGTISDSEWTLIAGATESEYQLAQEDAEDNGQKIRVEVIQKYTVQKDEAKKINVVKTDNNPVSSETKDVAKGSLKEEEIKELIKTLTILYDGNTAESHNFPAIIGSTLYNTKVSVSPASGTVKDSEENDVTVSVAVSLVENQTAPNSSDYVPVKIKVTAKGYGDVEISLGGTGEEASPLFVYVKRPPVESTEIPTLVEETPNPTITGGYVKFTSPVTEGLEYTVTDSSATAPASGASWNKLTDAEFKNGENEFAGGEKIFIRRAGAAGEADGKENPVGYIEPSVIYSNAISVASENVGKKNALKIVSVKFESQSDIKITQSGTEITQSGTGKSITLTVENAPEGAVFEWKTEAEIFGYTNNPLTIGANGSSATVTIADNALPGVYGIVVTASKDSITYSSTVYITVGTN
ncbi:hypothetical protein DYE50_01160 [Treponema ruminis]|uniref:Putative repeat protein (TIGR02543 family) n=1 Tax=Treponema ruminis TaxID=744515 RepID=A0A7W8GBR3_9SPIR|nr:InlB B-repeat-containing protein [Treponema ruminis]MBB5227294.1 putative repeat protein (TIGR02543 family) [Treponema ruminis]QSI01192.1 hypothetical protein DYE50_01160 [Treponema ruminis]